MEGLGKVEPTTYMNEIPVTIEEEKQMDTIITGVSGNQYKPMDTTPSGQPVHTQEPFDPVGYVSVFSERSD